MMENRIQSLKPFLATYVNEITTPSPKAGKNMYVCPICGSGSREGGSGAFSVKGDHWHCFSASCGVGGDIIDLYQKVNNTSRNEAINELSKKYLFESASSEVAVTVESKPSEQKLSTSEQAERLRNICPHVLNDSQGLAYLQRRGISSKTVARFEIKVGYVFVNREKQPALFFFSEGVTGSVFRRQISEPKEGERAFKGNLGPKAIFNFYAVKNTDRPVFVVEGEIDALSLEEIGCPAVGLSSADNYLKFVTQLIESGEKPQLVLMLDNDSPGLSAELKLLSLLKEKGFKAIALDRETWGYQSHDPNDWLRENREGFEQLRSLDSEYFKKAIEGNDGAVSTALNEAVIQLEGIEPPIEEIEKTIVSTNTFPTSIGDRWELIRERLNNAPAGIPTAFPSLNKIMKSGGLTRGLYLIGAPPSTGKSAFCLQIADEIAKAGHKVLFYSLEMLEEEMLMRSLVRCSAFDSEGNFEKVFAANLEQIEEEFKTNKTFNHEKAFVDYREIAKNVYYECFADTAATIETMELQIESFCKLYKDDAPVIFIDYLQLIKLENPKHNADTLFRLSDVSARLKKLSNLCPIVVVSSINRQSYDIDNKKKDPGLDAFKGSGDIEYSCNLALLLLKRDKNESAIGLNDKKELAIKIVKNRSGRSNVAFDLDFYGPVYYFEDKGNLRDV